MMERYIRQTRLKDFGEESQYKLKRASVLIVGAGGLGVPALQYLTGMGVGRIGIMDADRVHISNLHRQVLYTTAEIGKYKAELAAVKMNQLNPGVTIDTHLRMLDNSNALEIIQNYDMVIDATDNFNARLLINDACVILNKPYVYGAVQQYEGHVSVFNYLDGPTYRCLYEKPPSGSEIPDCNEAGVLGVVPGIVGCWQALEAVKIITGVGKTLSGFLKITDFASGEEYKVRLKLKAENKLISSLQAAAPFSCSPTTAEISVEELYSWYKGGKSFLLLDVREEYEFEAGHLMYARSMPLGELSTTNGTLPSAIPLVALCQKGGRSLQAIRILKDKQPELELYNVSGGMNSWSAVFNDELIETEA